MATMMEFATININKCTECEWNTIRILPLFWKWKEQMYDSLYDHSVVIKETFKMQIKISRIKWGLEKEFIVGKIF